MQDSTLFNQNLPDQNLPALDKDGHLVNHLDWTPDVARLLAAREQLILSDEHLQVLQGMREYYRRFEHAPATRPLIKFLMQTVSADLTNAHLMALFNTGLVARTLARLAGLPKPANCL
jgi:tRNA 2-thiouridine synthesizing protein E